MVNCKLTSIIPIDIVIVSYVSYSIHSVYVSYVYGVYISYVYGLVCTYHNYGAYIVAGEGNNLFHINGLKTAALQAIIFVMHSDYRYNIHYFLLLNELRRSIP